MAAAPEPQALRSASMSGELPVWEPRATRQLSALAQQLLVLGAATPLRLRAELTALQRDFEAGRPRAPRFHYATPPRDVRPALTNLLRQLRARNEPLAELYAERCHEMWLEAQLCQSAGSPDFPTWAARRYAPRDGYDDQAMALAEEWAQLTAPDAPRDNSDPPRDDPGASRDDPDASRDDPGPSRDDEVLIDQVRSDDASDPRSLLCRMRAEVGRRRLPFRVEVSERLAALAATGAGVIYVAQGRPMRVRDVERTVLHEIEGHALPRARAARCALGLVALGSARGSDEQEGRALLLEQRAELLCARRRAELGRRHLAACAAHERVPFVETVARLRAYGCPLQDALRIGARAYRGGGLGRERAYLPAWLRVKAALAEQPELEQLLQNGKLSIAAAAQLATLVPARWLRPQA